MTKTEFRIQVTSGKLLSFSQLFSGFLQNQHFVLGVQTVVLVRSSQLFVRRIQLSRVAAANIQRIVNTNHVVATISASPITIIISITELWYYMRISDAVILSCLVLCFIHMIQIWWHEHR